MNQPFDQAIFDIQTLAADMRASYKLDAESPIEVTLPHWKHNEYLKQWGSQQALDEQFGPKLKLICVQCRDIAEAAVDNLRARGIVQ